MEEVVQLVEQSVARESRKRFITTPVIDKPAVADYKLRVDNQPLDWSEEFGTEERFQFVKQNIDVDIDQQTRFFMDRRGMDQPSAQREAERKFKVEKRSFTENGRTVEYFYYKMPITYLMHFVGKDNAVSKPFTEYVNKTYDINPPVIAFAVRSKDHDRKHEGKELQTDFGAVAVTAGWTGNAFNMVDIRTGTEHTMLEDLLESNGRGHGAVFILPSLHFEGAINRGKSTLDDKELFNSGRAAMFYEDMLSILGINNFIGHSRGGDVAHLLQAKYPSLNCLALMPASDEKPRSHMHNAFKLLQLATWAGQIPLPGQDTPDFKTFLGTELTRRLITDGTLSDDIIRQLSADHRAVIKDASGRAINQVIGILGEGYRDGWNEIEYTGLPAVISLGRDDALSIYQTVKQFVDRRFDTIKERLQSQCYPGAVEAVLTELYTDLVVEFDKAGHYSFEDPKVRRKILDLWWEELDRTKITDDSLAAARTLKNALKPVPGHFPPLLRIVSRSDVARDPPLNERTNRIQTDKTTVIRLTVYESEQLRRAGEQLGYGSSFAQSIAQYDGITAALHGWDREMLTSSRDELRVAATEAVSSADWQSCQLTRSFETRRNELINRLLVPAETIYGKSEKRMPESIRKQLVAVIYLHMQQDWLINTVVNDKSAPYRDTEAYTVQRNIYESVLRTFLNGSAETLIASLRFTREPDQFEKMLGLWFDRMANIYEQSGQLFHYEDITKALTGKPVSMLDPSQLLARIEKRPAYPSRTDQITSLCSEQLVHNYQRHEPQDSEDEIYSRFLQPGKANSDVPRAVFSQELHALRKFVDYRRILSRVPTVHDYAPPIEQIDHLFKTEVDRYTAGIADHVLANGSRRPFEWETIRGLLAEVDSRLRQALIVPELNSEFMAKLHGSTKQFVDNCKEGIAVI